MKIPKKLAKYLAHQIDFSTFTVFEVIPNETYGSIVMVLPRVEKQYSYCGLILGNGGQWFTDAEEMINAAERQHFISRLKRVILLLRYRHAIKKT